MARRKVIVCWGQSNMDGQGLLSALATIGGTKWDHTGVYSGIYYWQNAMYDYVSTAGQWTQLDFADSRYDGAPTSAYDYPVNASKPAVTTFERKFGIDLELAWGRQAELGEPIYVVKLAPGGTYISRCEPLSTAQPPDGDWFWPHAHRSWHPSLPDSDTPFTSTTVATLPGAGVTYSGTGLSDPSAPGALGSNLAGYWVVSGSSSGLIVSNTTTSITISAWHPLPTVPVNGTGYTIQTRSFYSASLIKKLVSYLTAAAAASGADGIDVIDIYSYIGESEATEEDRATEAGSNMKACMAYLRGQIASNGWSTQPAHKIAWTLIGPKETSVWPYASTVNDQYRSIADEDAYCTFVDSTPYSYGGSTGTDTFHNDAQGLYDLAQAALAARRSLSVKASSASTPDDTRPTLAQMRDRVRRRYTGAGQSNDPSDEKLDQAINNALRRIYQWAGDEAWFLRRIDTLRLSGGSTTPITLPILVGRIVRIEDSTFPGVQVEGWKGVGYDSGGRLKIQVTQQTGGNLVVHSILKTRDLTSDDERILVPGEYSELVEVVSCYVLAGQVPNVTLMQVYDKDMQELKKAFQRDCQRHDRHRREALSATEALNPWVYWPVGP